MAKLKWIKFVQAPMMKDLLESIQAKDGEEKISGPYKKLSPYKDDQGVWRVGLRNSIYDLLPMSILF